MLSEKTPRWLWQMDEAPCVSRDAAAAAAPLPLCSASVPVTSICHRLDRSGALSRQAAASTRQPTCAWKSSKGNIHPNNDTV